MGAPFSSKAVTQFFWCKKPISATIFVLISSSLKTGETFCIQDFTPEKKSVGEDSQLFECLSKNLPPFLFPDQTFTNLFPVFERWGQNHQFFVDTCGLNALVVFFWFSCSCVRGRSNFRFSTRTSFYIQPFQYSYLISIGDVK